MLSEKQTVAAAYIKYDYPSDALRVLFKFDIIKNPDRRFGRIDAKYLDEKQWKTNNSRRQVQ